MGFSKIQLGKDFILETKIFDETYRQVGNWKVMKKDYPNTVKIIFDKIGINAKVTEGKPKEEKEYLTEEDIDRDLNWLK